MEGSGWGEEAAMEATCVGCSLAASQPILFGVQRPFSLFFFKKQKTRKKKLLHWSRMM
jgi:hypothetical protein